MLLDRLRHETATQHRALESTMDFPQTLAAYEQRLKCFYGYLEPWERLTFAQLKDLPAVLDRQTKTSWLKQDLEHFGLSATDLDRLPRCTQLPSLTSAAHAMGSLYVWEGSTLGGMMISKYLRETLSIEPQTGGRYFSSYGSDTGKQWKAFSAQLLQFSSRENDPVIIRSATETFATLQQWVLSTA